MCPADHLHLSIGSHALQPILTNRLQHHEAWLLSRFLLHALQQALIDERGHRVQDHFCSLAQFSADGLSCLQCAAAGKDGEPPEELPLLGVQQLVAPLDSVAQGLLPLRHIARTARQYLQALAQPRQQRLG